MLPEHFNCFIIGNGSLVILCAEYILEKECDILGIITSNEYIISWCGEKGIKVIEENSLDELKKYSFDYLFSIVYLEVIPADIINLPKKLAINYHDALLPEYAGIHTVSWAIMNGKKIHGITWHIMHKTLDSGNLLVQKSIEIQKNETAVSLNLKCFQAALEGFYELIDGIQSNNLQEKKQDFRKRNYFGKWTKPLNAGLINWYQDTEKIISFVHSLNFGPYENTLASAKISYGGKFYIVEDIEKSGVCNEEPGLTKVYNDKLIVSTKDSAVIISGIKTITGDRVHIFDVFGGSGEIYNLSVDKSVSGRLEDRMNKVSKSEPYWVRKLLKVSYCVIDFIGMSEDTDEKLMITGKSALENILIALRNWLERFNLTEYFIGYSSSKYINDGLFASIVPFSIKIDKNNSNEEIIADLRREIDIVEAKGTFVRDVYYRYEKLRGKEFKPQILIYNGYPDDLSEIQITDICFFVSQETDRVDFVCSDKKYEVLAKYIIKKSRGRKCGNMNNIEVQREESFISTYQLICGQAVIHKNKTAVISGNNSITYEELIKKVDIRAGIFKKYGIDKGMHIGVLLHRSYEIIVSFLAIMKLGAIYIPMDSTYPKERLSYMAEDGEIKYLITESKISTKLSGSTFKTIYIDEEDQDILIETREVKPQPKDAVYILYTSGSTGKPKGVIVNHLGLSNFLLSMKKEPGFTSEDKLMALTTVCFDISGLEIYLPLISGGQVEIIPSEVINDGITLREKIEASDATVIQATPAAWNMLLMAGWEMKLNIKILCGGENLPIELADRLLKQCNELWNMYGPTETTIWSTIKRVADKNDITIGKPIGNTTVYILDKNKKVVNDSQTGELYIGGDGVANGYYKREDITSEKFIDNPANPGEVVYRTGDLAKFNHRGDLIYLGRVDNQIKYHGYRIELEEIEQVVQDKLNFDKAVVVLRKDALGENAIYAFIQAEREIELEKELAALGEFLPNYMLPSEFIPLTTFPLTANKKINRKVLVSLPIEDIIDRYRTDAAHINSVEINDGDSSEDGCLKEVLKIAAEVIKHDIKDIDINKNLSTYGYNSIRYTVLSTKINKQLNTKITPALCYTYKTVKELANYISSNRGNPTQPKKSIYHANLKDRTETPVKEESKFKGKEKSSDTGTKTTPFKMPLDHSDGEVLRAGTEGKFESNKKSSDAGTKNAQFHESLVRGVGGVSCAKNVYEDILDDVAVIGISVHFPKADSLEDIWKILKNNECVIGNIPKDRWDVEKYTEYDSEYPNYGAFMDDIWSFDSDFFHLTPRETMQMDPQQRLFLITSWEAIEDAGYNPEELAGENIAVYAGTVESDYYNRLSRNIAQADIFTISGNIQCGIANRVSYMLDFHGESETINTACSSSLVAIDHAVKAVSRKECSLAIAGGVNIIFNPFMHYSLKQNGMLSPDGKCKSFDADANGYVRGEGCGALLLKSLKTAIRDGDNIYGIIKGSAVNHDGRTNSFSAPNPVMQAELIGNAYKKAGIRPDYVSYIETHGTGTKLGDPIEINALKDAFDRLYSYFNIPRKTKYCALGAIKANIGHLEAAAGVAGVIKVLICMRERMLPQIAQLKEINPYIELDDSPFYILKGNEEWLGVKDDNGDTRHIAGISSFGFGGTNAHIVIESYVGTEKAEQHSIRKEIFVLSANTTNGLKNYAESLKQYVKYKLNVNDKSKFRNIAYTLQTGRKVCDYRAAFIAGNLEELAELLNIWISGKTDNRIIEGNNKKNIAIDALFDGKEGEEYITKLLNNNQLEKIGYLWVLGAHINWEVMYEGKCEKVSLPTYPFTKEKYRLESIDNYLDGACTAVKGEEENIIKLAPEHHCVNDHIINGSKVLPGIKYLDIAVKSCFANKNTAIHLKSNEWIIPKIVTKDDILEVEKDIKTEETVYKIYSTKSDRRILHAKGKAVYDDEKRRAGNIDIEDVKASFSNKLSKEQIYNKYRELGYDYGTVFKPLESLYYSEKEALSSIHITDEIRKKTENEIINISLFEGGMQAVMGCIYDSFKSNFMPSCIKDCYIYTMEVPEYAYGYAKLVNSIQVEQKVTKEFDIYITDEFGNIIIELLGYVISLVTGRGKPEYKPENIALLTKKITESGIDISMTESFNSLKILVMNNPPGGGSRIFEKLNEKGNVSYIELLDMNNKDRLSEKMKDVDIVLVFSDNKNINEKNIYQQLAKTAGTLINSYFNGRLIYIFEDSGADFHCYEKAAEGFARCYQNETVHSVMKVIQADHIESNTDLIVADIISDNHVCVSYKNGRRYITEYVQSEEYIRKELIQDKEGVYIITGGTGYLGVRLAKELCTRYSGINVILLGRNGLDSEQKQYLKDMKNQIHEVKADVMNYTQITGCFEEVNALYGTIKGIFHLAGALDDCYIKDRTDFSSNKVIGPKINGIMNIDLALKDQALDFMVLFSSISAVTGNAGQSDYCYANSFLNSFAEFRNTLVERQSRNGKTLSINWGIWKDGGMKLPEAEMQYLKKHTGMKLLETRDGFNILLDTDLFKTADICVVNADKETFLQRVNNTKEVRGRENIKENRSFDIDKKLMESLKDCCCKTIGIDRSKLIENKEFSDYGFDSLTNTSFADEINEKLGLEITPVAFFEFTCLESLANYLKEEYRDTLEKHFSGKEADDAKCPEQSKNIIETIPEEMESYYRMDLEMPYVSAHTVFGKPVILGVTYVGHFYHHLIKTGVRYGDGSFKNVLFHEPAAVNKDDILLFKTSCSRKNTGLSFSETCKKGGTEFTVATGIFTCSGVEEPIEIDWKSMIMNADRVIDGKYIYNHKWRYDVNYSEILQSVDKVYLKNDVVIGKLRLKPEMKEMPYEVNPAVLDASVICGLYAFLEDVKESYIPYMIKKIMVNGRVAEDCCCICKKNMLNDELIYMDITIVDEKGSVLCAMKDFICKKVTSKARFGKSERSGFQKKQETVEKEDIAVIGMSASFAGSKTPGEYWTNLIERKDLIKEIPADHFEYKNYYDPESKGNDMMYTKWGGFIDDVDKFDAPFFRISRREAQVMDPQLRLLLQHVYHASEDAGYAGTVKGSKTGMYVGCCFHDYQQKMDRICMPVSPHDATGNALTMLANRPSYCLDLKGPSVNVDTACSSSLAALHIACRGLIHGECDMAFAAGVNLLLDSWHYRYFCSIGALSKTGRCHTFTDRADGYIPGEGVAVVLLKPLSKAIRDNDNIYGVIKGSAINHGGLTSSITVPSIAQEAQVIEDAWRDAGVSGEDISYIEAHGTGTRLGDPIEINALKHVLDKIKAPKQECCIGSAKAHIGHTEGAAGLAGLIKVLLSMRNNTIPAMPYFDKMNPYIKLDKTNIRINREPVKWEVSNGKKIAGISSFGAGGAYAHVVVEEYSSRRRSALNKPRLIILSAKSTTSLRKKCRDLIAYIQSEKGRQADEVLLKDISYTLIVGREQMNVRLAFAAKNLDEITDKLKNYLVGFMNGIYFNELDEDRTLSLKNIEDAEKLEEAAGRWVSENNIDVRKPIGFEKEETGRIPLPVYPFEKKSYWITERTGKNSIFTININDFFIKNHIIDKTNIMPAVAYLDYVLKTAESEMKRECLKFLNINFLAPLELTSDTKDIIVEFDINSSDFKIVSKDEFETIVHVQGSLSNITRMEGQFKSSAEYENLPHKLQSSEFYNLLGQYGLHIGEDFQTIQRLEYSTSKVKTYISLKPELKDTFDSYVLHPAVMDGILQAAISRDNDNNLHIPFEIKSIYFLRNLKKDIIAYCSKNILLNKWDITVTDTDGFILLIIEGLLSKEVSGGYWNSEEDSNIIDILTKLSKGEKTIDEVNDQLVT